MFCYFSIFFVPLLFLLFRKTKVSLLVFDAFSAKKKKTSVEARANLCSVKELPWESQSW